MSTHYVDRYRYTHDKRRKFFMRMVQSGTAEIVSTLPKGVLIKTINGIHYRVSRKGNVVKVSD